MKDFEGQVDIFQVDKRRKGTPGRGTSVLEDQVVWADPSVSVASCWRQASEAEAVTGQ